MPTFSFPALLFQQRSSATAPHFAVFSATVSDLLAVAAIRRRNEETAGQQRRVSKAKVAAIARFFQQDDRNTIAPAVTIALRPGTFAVDPPTAVAGNPLQTLTMEVQEAIEERDKPGIVIDGQHRLLGMQRFNPQARLPVVAILEPSDEETAFQFVVINNKATRVATDLVRTLALDYSEVQLENRLRAARVTLDKKLRLIGIIDADPDSPFHDMLSFETATGTATTRCVPPAAIESALAMIRDKDVRDLSDDDALLAFFTSIWRTVRSKWPDLWQPGSKLLHKVSIVAVTSFISEGLFHKFDYDGLDITDPDAVAAGVTQILESQSRELWTSEWGVPISDSRAVRDRIIAALERVGRNIRSGLDWKDEVDLISN